MPKGFEPSRGCYGAQMKIVATPLSSVVFWLTSNTKPRDKELLPNLSSSAFTKRSGSNRRSPYVSNLRYGYVPLSTSPSASPISPDARPPQRVIPSPPGRILANPARRPYRISYLCTREGLAPYLMGRTRSNQSRASMR